MEVDLSVRYFHGKKWYQQGDFKHFIHLPMTPKHRCLNFGPFLFGCTKLKITNCTLLHLLLPHSFAASWLWFMNRNTRSLWRDVSPLNLQQCLGHGVR